MFSRFIAIAGGSMGMLFSQPKLIVKPFSQELTIQSVSDAAAQAMIPSTFHASLGTASKVLPYSLLLTNNTSSTIIGYTLHYSSVSEKGEPYTFNRVFYNFGVKSNGVEIPPGATQLATPLTSHRLNAPSVQRSGSAYGSIDDADKWLSSIAGQSVLIISVDLVVLDSGKVLGPNDGGTMEGLDGFLSGQAEAISIVRSALARNLTGKEIAVELHKKLDEERLKNTRAAMTRATEFRKFARFAQQSKELLINEVSNIEKNFRAVSLTR